MVRPQASLLAPNDTWLSKQYPKTSCEKMQPSVGCSDSNVDQLVNEVSRGSLKKYNRFVEKARSRSPISRKQRDADGLVYPPSDKKRIAAERK